MAEYESTASQKWRPDSYVKNARFVSDLAHSVVDLLDPRKDERILDLGCGNGDLMERIRSMGAGVVGFDQSEAFIASCRQKGLDARLGDGENLPFDQEFDAVFSNAALHWMKRMDKVVQGIARALKPGGRFVCECGGKGNIAQVIAAVTLALELRGIDPGPLNPWRFLDVAEAEAILGSNSFKLEQAQLITRPTILPGTMQDWLETFAQSFLSPFQGEERQKIKAEIEETLRHQLYSERDRHWVADYVRLRFKAIKI